MKIFCIERSAFLAARVQLLRRDFVTARFASIAHANKLDSVSYSVILKLGTVASGRSNLQLQAL